MSTKEKIDFLAETFLEKERYGMLCPQTRQKLNEIQNE